MRLKGGKVLIDLTSLGDVQSDADIEYQLDEETRKSIIEKGLIIKISYKGLNFVVEPVIEKIDVTNDIITYHALVFEGGFEVLPKLKYGLFGLYEN